MTRDVEAELAAARATIGRLSAELDSLRSRPAARPHRTDRSDPLSAALYKTVVESITDYAVITTDLSGRIILWNDAAAAIFGTSADAMIGLPIDEIFTPEDRENGRPAVEMGLAATEGRAADNRWHLKGNGDRFFARGELVPLLDEIEGHVGYLKILRDRTQEEEARLELAASRERLQFALDASALVGTWDWDLRENRVYADARFADLYGIGAERASAGLPIEDYIGGVHPDDRAALQAGIEKAVTDAAVFAQEYRTVRGDGEVRWIYARGRCFVDTQGRPVRFPGAVVDITREKLRERRQAALLRLGDDGAEFGESFDYTLRALELLGETLEINRVGYASVDPTQTYATIIGEWTRPGHEQLSGRLALAQFGSALLEGMRAGLVLIEDVTTNALTMDGLAAWERIGARSLVNMAVVEDGRVQVILYLHHGVPRLWTDEEVVFVRETLNRAWTYSRRRRIEQSLLETETRLRLAHEAAEIGSFDYDLKTGALVWDRRCREAFGIADEEPVTYKNGFVAQLYNEDRNRVVTQVERAMDPTGDGSFDMVFRTIGRDDGALRYIHASGQTVVENGAAVRFVCAVQDVTEGKEAEERQILLTRELQHRVKNTLAMVNALANQTLRRAANAQDGLAAFSARLIALSHAHDILTQTSWTSAPIEAVVSQTLASHKGEGERITWSGPDIRLTAKQSLALALALHELATNALKYGSLSNDTGQVTIGWHIAMAGGRQRLHFEWRETGGPAVTEPTRRGFGSRLIEQSLALEFGGQVAVTYEPEGVSCTIDADLQLDLDEDAILPLKLDDIPEAAP